MFNQRAVRIRAGTRPDRGGNTVSDWSPAAASRLPVAGLNIQPATQREDVTEQRDASITDYRVQSAEGTAPDVRAGDRIEWDGLLYEVEGEVGRWPELFSDTVHHVEWYMTRATG